MVYKKYTSDGKNRYGPYLYKSKRVGEEIVTTYLGKNEKKRIDKIFLFLFVAILIVGVISLASLFVSLSSTGKVSSNLENVIYSPGENLAGIVSFNVKEGELIPENAKIIITNGQQTKELPISQLSPLTSMVYGNYYAEGSSLSGNGGGYGFIGRKKVYPEVDFQLLISNIKEETASEPAISNETQESSLPETPEPVLSEIPESSVPENLEQPATSNEGNEGNEGSDGVQLTGNSVIENAYVLDAKTIQGQDYVYNVEQGQSVELVKGSVKYNGSEIGDDKVSLSIDNNVAKVSTDYFVYEPGFGRDYLGDYVSTLNLDLGSTGILAEDSNVYIKIVYGETVILSTERDIIVSENQTSEINLSLAVIKEIPMLRLVRDSPYDLDLSEYFTNADSYDVELDNLSSSIEGSILTLQADSGFKGMSRGKIIARSDENSVSLDLVVMVSSGAVNIKTSSSRIKVGEPVKWQKNVSLEIPEQIVVEVPKEAENIVVKPIEELGASNGLTGFISADVRFWKESKFNRFLRNAFSVFTGRAVDEISGDNSVSGDSIELNLIDNATQYTIDYETPGPIATETETATGKQVVISAPDELNYTDVLAFTNISEVYNVGEENKIKLYWVESEIYIPFDAYDLDGNGKIDYLEWIVPHLSNQTFDVIYNSSSTTIYDCGNITEAGTYTLNQSIEQIGGGDCLLIQADDVVINGQGFTVTGNVNGSGMTEGSNGYDFNLTNLVVGDVIGRSMNLSDGSYSQAGNGSTIKIENSVVEGIVDISGGSIGGSGSSLGGNGGILTIVNSTVNKVFADGGIAWNGGNGGNVYLQNLSSINEIYARGGVGVPDTDGNGGNVMFDTCPIDPAVIIDVSTPDHAGGASDGTVTCYDAMAPLIEFGLETPTNSEIVNVSSFNVSLITSDDSGDHYSFLNFNNSLVAWWRGENNANDDSGNGNSGTLNGDVIYNSSGKFGSAFSFDGSDDYVSKSSPAYIPSSNQSFTFSSWFKTNLVGDWQRILFYGQGGSNDAGYGISNGGYLSFVEDLVLEYTDDTTPISSNVWYHGAVTYDGSDLNLYLNGVVVKTFSSVTLNVISANEIRLGSRLSGGGEFWNGSIDDVLIFNRRLSQEEIRSLYNATANQYMNNFSDLANVNYNIQGFAVDSVGKKNQTEVRTIEVDTSTLLTAEVTTCGTIRSPGTYTLMNNIGTGDDCILIKADDVTINGQGFLIDGSINAMNVTAQASAHTNLNLSNIELYGDFKVDGSAGSDYGGNGGNVTIINSSLRVLNLNGGDGTWNAGGGFAGRAVLINSSVGIINSNGGGSYWVTRSGGSVILLNSTVTNITALGSWGVSNSGAGGSVNLTNSSASIVNVNSGSGTVASQGGSVYFVRSNATLIDANGAGGQWAGTGGFVSLIDSNVDDVTVNGGYASNNGGFGGTIIVVNSNLVSLSANAGNSTSPGSGGPRSGGSINITNSDVDIVSARGGTDEINGGTGGNVTFSPCPDPVPTVDVSGGVGSNSNGADGIITPDYCYAGYVAPDTVFPLIEFDDMITPLDASTLTVNNFNVSMITSDNNGDHYSFLNFNNSLVGWWRAENNANDDSVNGNNGTRYGGSSYVNGQFGRAFSFNGINQYVGFNDSGLPNGSSARTISNWIKTTENSEQYSFRYGTWTTNKGFGIGTYSNGKLMATQYGAGVFGNTVVTDGSWHNAVYVWNGTRLFIYLDGRYDANGTFTVGTVLSNGLIGTARSDYQSYFWNGSVDDILVFNRSLSASEVASLYNATANQYNNNFTNLRNRNYTLQGFVIDSAGNKNWTESRTVGVAVENFSLTECTTIDQAGRYILQNDINFSTAGGGCNYRCFNITADNVIFDGNGKTLIGANMDCGGLDSYVISTNGVKNVVIKNLTTIGANRPISLYYTNNSIVQNVTVTNYDIIGIEFVGNNISIIENNITSSCPCENYPSAPWAFFGYGDLSNSNISNNNMTYTFLNASLNYTNAGGYGIITFGSYIENNSYENNRVINATYGFLWNSLDTSNNVIRNNYVDSGMVGTGAYLTGQSSRNNQFVNNVILNSPGGLDIDGNSSYNLFENNTIINSTYAFAIWSWNCGNSGGLVGVYSPNNYYVGNNITNSEYGIYGKCADNITFTNNILNNVTTGFYTETSFVNESGFVWSYVGNVTGSRISNNIFSNGNTAIHLNDSLYTNITGNTFSGNTIDLYSTPGSNGSYILDSARVTIENESYAKVELVTLPVATDLILNRDILISNNSIRLSNFVNFSLANISIYGSPGVGLSDPVIARSGAICNDCNNYTSLLDATVIFSISQAGNYSIADRLLATMKAITTLRTGWNMFAIQTNETTSDEDVEIPLVANKYNLVGVSSDENVSLETRTVQQQSQGVLGRLSALFFGIQSTEESDVDFTLSNGTEVTWDSAASGGKVKKYLAYYDTSNSSAKKYKYAGFQDSSLRGNKGYWVYATEAGNLTLKGVGGSQTGSYVPVGDLRFSNGTLTLNYNLAKNLYGWVSDDIGADLYYWNTGVGNGTWTIVSSRPSNPNMIYPWEGLVIKMNVDNITIYAPN